MNVIRHLNFCSFLKYISAILLILVIFVALNVKEQNGIKHILEVFGNFATASDYYKFPSFEELIKHPFVIEQDDRRLIEKIRNNFLRPPTGMPYNLTNPQNLDPHKENTQEIRKILKDKKNGFFIECGAFMGEQHSHSIFFERFMGWTGILIEPVPEHFHSLKSKNRNSWIAQLCLSPNTYPSEVSFQVNGWGSAIEKYSKQTDKKEFVIAQCVPLYSILLALNVTKVDYFILDVEAVEFEVLKTIPWDKVNITVIMAEVQFLGDQKENLVRYMEKQGYKLYNNITDFKAFAMDYTFYHPLLQP